MGEVVTKQSKQVYSLQHYRERLSRQRWGGTGPRFCLEAHLIISEGLGPGSLSQEKEEAEGIAWLQTARVRENPF